MRKLAALLASLPACAMAAGEADTAAKAGISSSQIVSWLFSTCAIVAFILVLAYIVKKTRVRLGGGGQSRVLSQIPVGPKERIAEVRIAGRRLIVGVTPQNVSLLCDLGPDGGAEFTGRLEKERKSQEQDPAAGAPKDGDDAGTGR